MDLDWYTATTAGGDDHDDGDFSPYDLEDEDEDDWEEDDADSELYPDDNDQDFLFHSLLFFEQVLPPCTLHYYFWLDDRVGCKAPWIFFRDRILPIIAGLAMMATAYCASDNTFGLLLLPAFNVMCLYYPLWTSHTRPQYELAGAGYDRQ